MYAGRVACCPLESHDEHAPTGQLSDGRKTVALCFQLDMATVINNTVPETMRANCHSAGRRFTFNAIVGTDTCS